MNFLGCLQQWILMLDSIFKDFVLLFTSLLAISWSTPIPKERRKFFFRNFYLLLVSPFCYMVILFWTCWAEYIIYLCKFLVLQVHINIKLVVFIYLNEVILQTRSSVSIVRSQNSLQIGSCISIPVFVNTDSKYWFYQVHI